MAEEPDAPPKTFTVEEANALLPRVKALVEQLQGLQRSIAQTNQQLDECVRKVATGNGYPIQSLKQQIDSLTQHQLQLIEGFQSALTQLEEQGGWLKDLNIGLIDFYGLRDDKLIFLCWKLGEDRIRFWHTLEDGYAGRQPL
ncbi:MAG: DUF2203 domain-containing protein [Candidatus Omnitrophica bacterium]|nr:DUF2203 domain-containing protein [Candidatus Omnitrophota bacterium]MBI3082756.1 DUF2203 domain-containing protein [Candidatus Omnitrophota bacterium]